MDINILNDLLNLDSPSDLETETIDYIKRIPIKNFTLFKKLSTNHNLVFYKNNNSKNNLLIDAHIDEICTRIHYITDDGFIIVKSIGTDEQNLYGRPVKILSSKTNKKIKGVYLIDPAHFKKTREKYKDPLNKNLLYIDIGLKSKKDVEKIINIGDHVLTDYNSFKINKETITGRGLDNKIGTAILINIFKYFDTHKSKYNLILNFSSREEIGNTPYLNHNVFQIDEVIVLDTIYATDVPFISKELYGDIELHNGPVLERGGSNKNLYNKLNKLCNKSKIPNQTYLSNAGGSNLDFFSKYSCLTQFIGVPTRNLHSPVETASIKDIKNTYKLIKAYIS
jgi:putative aminopeptidase FrvX